MIAARYYRDARMLAAARQPAPVDSETRDYVSQFTRLTHDFAPGESPTPPRASAAPR